MSILAKLNIVGKTLDQPIVVAKFNRVVPAILVGGAVAAGAKDIYNKPKKEKQKTFIKNFSVLSCTLLAALMSVRGIKPIKFNNRTIFKGFNGLIEHGKVCDIAKSQQELTEAFLENNKGILPEKAKKLLNSAVSKFKKQKVLSFSEVGKLYKEIGTTEKGNAFLNELIPEPIAVTYKEIFGEIKRLSTLGLVPVVGGIAGGIAGDAINKDNCKEKLPNKIKEGFYQYFANIFLCNIGAGGALFALNRLQKYNIIKQPSKLTRAAAMIGGILSVGVIGGSSIANFLSKKCIDPLCNKACKDKNKGLYAERHPECLDVALHADDIATVGVFSGVACIEPALPIMYSISGYRAGMGYRNGNKCCSKLGYRAGMGYRNGDKCCSKKAHKDGINVNKINKKPYYKENYICIKKKDQVQNNYTDKDIDKNLFSNFKNNLI